MPLKDEAGPAAANPPCRFFKPLLEGIGRTAVEAGPGELTEFVNTLDAIAAELAEATEPDAILRKVAEAVKAIEDHNRRAAKTTEAYRGEMHAILSMLVETVAALSTSSNVGMEQLSTIEKSLVSASTANDLKIVRNKLAGCLTLVRNESVRLKRESEKLIQGLRATVVRASAQALPTGEVTSLDPVSGLAGPEAAQQLIANALVQQQSLTAVVLVLKHIMELNASSGRKAGDEILAVSGNHFRSELAEFSPLFRWNGPAFLFLIRSDHPMAGSVQERVKEVAKKRLDHHLNVERGAVHFTVHFTWAVQEINPTDSVESTALKLDKFVAAQSA